jgi:RNA polymerase sigma factor (sigma-70 family)
LIPAGDSNEADSFISLIREMMPAIEGRSARLAAGDPILQDELELSGVLGVYEAFEKFDPSWGMPLVAFAKSYALNRIADQMRSERAVQAHFEDPPLLASTQRKEGPSNFEEALGAAWLIAPEYDDSLDDPLNATIDEERREAVRQFVEALPTKLREVAFAHFYRGLTQAETARELGVSRTSVSNYVKDIAHRGSDCSPLSVYKQVA